MGISQRIGAWYVQTVEQLGLSSRMTGYRGRTGIYELLAVDDSFRRLIHDRASEQVLRDHAQAARQRHVGDQPVQAVQRTVGFQRHGRNINRSFGSAGSKSGTE